MTSSWIRLVLLLGSVSVASVALQACDGEQTGSGGAADDDGDGDDDDDDGDDGTSGAGAGGQGGAPSTSAAQTSGSGNGTSNATTGSTAASTVTSAAATVAASTSTGATCLEDAPSDPTATDDCEDFVQLISGTIDTQVHTMGHLVTDDFCSLEPSIESSYPDELVVCQYFSCIYGDGGASLTCPANTQFSVDQFGDPGCCGAGGFAVDYNCTGASDDTVYVSYEVQPLSECGYYFFSVVY
jgi:hypothetical protein